MANRDGFEVSAIALPQAAKPTSSQFLLFRAALCPESEATEHTQALVDSLAEGVPGADTTPYLELLHRRLASQRNDPFAAAVRQGYRRTWVGNQLLFAALRNCLACLRAANVPTLVLKGAAVLPAYYSDMGSRSMGDFDLLVPRADFAAAVRALKLQGWMPVHPEEGFDARFSHALAMIDARGNNLDLHQHVLHFTTQPDADALFWAAAVPLRIQTLDSARLCDADMVLHLAVHGLRWAPTPQLRWIPDIAHVLRAGPLDWERLVWMSSHLHVSMAVLAVLGYLSDHGLAEIPNTVFQQLRQIPIDRRERELFQLSTQDTFSGLRTTTRFHWYIMTQNEAAGSLARRLSLLPSYLAHRRKIRAFGNWFSLLGAGLLRHLFSKFGRYDRSPTGHRLR